MMSFASAFDDVYEAVKDSVAIVDESMEVIRLDDIRAAGSITEDMVAGIRKSTLCLADVTDANPNVMWEVGFATALGKPVVVISQGGGKLPFDIQDIRTLKYSRASLSKTLRDPLADVLKATLERYVTRRSGLREEQQKPHLRAVAVTGSMSAPQGEVAERVDRVLRPYVGSGYHWYVGSFGSTDETVLDYLLKAGEKSITVVGYSSYDISERQLLALEKNPHVSFMDAQREQVLDVPGSSSKRDVLFASRADLLIVIWDGHSPGTKRLIDWLSITGKDHILGFVSSR